MTVAVLFADPQGSYAGLKSMYKRCDCGPCTYAASSARAERRRDPKPRVHGANAYKNGCRCDVCRVAHTAARRAKAAA